MHQETGKRKQTSPPMQSGELVNWVNNAKSGNRQAFEQLVTLFHEQVFRMVFYRTRSRMDAEDLTQEIFMKAFSGLNRLKEADKFKSWLFRIAANRVNDFHRRKKFQQMVDIFRDEDLEMAEKPEADARPDALEDIMKRQFWDEVNSLLNRLSRMERKVFMFRFLDHLSIREISEVMKRNESTVKTFLYRALQKFREETSLLNFLKENAS